MTEINKYDNEYDLLMSKTNVVKPLMIRVGEVIVPPFGSKNMSDEELKLNNSHEFRIGSD